MCRPDPDATDVTSSSRTPGTYRTSNIGDGGNELVVPPEIGPGEHSLPARHWVVEQTWGSLAKLR